jgi:hypothetical protein
MKMLMIIFKESLEDGIRDLLIQKQGGAKIPLRVFSLPCELVV